MNVAYIFEKDADSPDVQSGRPASILREFERAGMVVHRCFPLPVPAGTIERVQHRLARLANRRYFKGRSSRQLRRIAELAEARLREADCDFVFSAGTVPLAHLRTSKPIVFSSDCTFRNMLGYYPEYSRLSGLQIRTLDRAEQRALRKTDLLVYGSEWAANSAAVHYHVPRERIAVLPSGANIGAENTADVIEPLIAERTLDSIEFLFVGRDWMRKGGNLCVDTMRELRARGVKVRLHVVGSNPVLAADIASTIEVHGLLKPSVLEHRARLEALFRRSHFLFVPSRAEAFGMAFCEANAFGLPCLSTATGGIPTIVRPGVNGLLLPPNASAGEYAAAIAELVREPGRYQTMAHASFREFATRLNWRVWIRSFLLRLEAVLEPRRVSASAP